MLRSFKLSSRQGICHGHMTLVSCLCHLANCLQQLSACTDCMLCFCTLAQLSGCCNQLSINLCHLFCFPYECAACSLNGFMSEVQLSIVSKPQPRQCQLSLVMLSLNWPYISYILVLCCHNTRPPTIGTAHTVHAWRQMGSRR